MDNFKLSSNLRDDGGKGAARRLRSSGHVPAVLYGHKKDPVSLQIDEAEMRSILQKQPDSAIVDLVVGRDKEINVLVREIQRHPASGKLLHVDFQRISLDEKIRVDVRVDLQGDPVGVKEQGGVLEHMTRSVTILCLPREIPESFGLDVSQLQIGDSIKLKDVVGRYPDVEFADDEELTLVAVIPPRVEVKAVEEGEGEEEAEAAAGEGEPKEGGDSDEGSDAKES